MKLPTLKKIFVATSLLMMMQSSHALVVFDPSNWAQNNASAIAAVKNELNTYKQYIGQLVQIKNEIQNLRQMGVAGFAARALGVESEVKSIMQLRDASKNLYKTLQTNGDYVEGIQKLINVSGLTADEWLKREKLLVKQNNANATYLMKTGEDINRAVEEAQAQRDKVLSDNNLDDGIVAVASKTNVLLGSLGTLMSEQLMVMKSDIDVKAADKSASTLKQAKESEARRFVNERIKIQEQQNSALFD